MVVFWMEDLGMERKVGYQCENWQDWTSDLVGLGGAGGSFSNGVSCCWWWWSPSLSTCSCCVVILMAKSVALLFSWCGRGDGGAKLANPR